MSDQETQVIEPAGGHDAAGVVHHHPKPSAYVGIAIILAIVTGAEVAMYYVNGLDDWALTTILLVMMAVKFILVASWFMHLRFEAPIFKRLFYGGLVLALVAYSVFLGASGVFPFID